MRGKTARASHYPAEAQEVGLGDGERDGGGEQAAGDGSRGSRSVGNGGAVAQEAGSRLATPARASSRAPAPRASTELSPDLHHLTTEICAAERHVTLQHSPFPKPQLRTMLAAWRPAARPIRLPVCRQCLRSLSSRAPKQFVGTQASEFFSSSFSRFPVLTCPSQRETWSCCATRESPTMTAS